MKITCTTFFFFILHTILAQQVNINGIVTSVVGHPISGANIFIEGSYDGATSDAKGLFTFETNLIGNQVLVVTYIAFETVYIQLPVLEMKKLKVTLKQNISELETVTLTAGNLDANENSKAAVLTPMDIVTTAGALGDVVGALQTLPGTSSNANDGRLFVRGGDANETQIFIDGLRVFQPFLASANDTPTRGRNSPFLFKGVNFSTGGYSAEYGQALSSIVNLNSIDTPKDDEINLQLMSAGLGASVIKKWDKNAISTNAQYLNLNPYQNLIKQNIEFTKAFENFSAETVFRHQFKKGLFKLYTAINYTDFALIQEDINTPAGVPFSLKNRNSYLNSSYKGSLGNNWDINTGISYSNDDIKNDSARNNLEATENGFHTKIKLKKRFTNYVKLSFGSEHFLTDYNESFSFENFVINSKFKDHLFAAFAEGEFIINNKFAAKTGIRFSNTTTLKSSTFSPRISLAYKVSTNSQFAVAYGDFFQNPNRNILKNTRNIIPEKASHFLVNYLYQKEKRLFRAEVYHKTYNNLIKFDTPQPQPNSIFNNLGNGKASGLDLFWRDSASIKGFEYWASYSYIDTQRNFANYNSSAQPPFVTKHNFSLVTKYFHKGWRTQFGATYNFSSGRSYTNPNTSGFLNNKTRSFNDLSMNAAYLLSQQKIIFISVSNVLGFNNIFDYQYTNTPNANGFFNRRAIGQPAKRFLFIGFFWTISKDKSKNQLENL